MKNSHSVIDFHDDWFNQTNGRKWPTGYLKSHLALINIYASMHLKLSFVVQKKSRAC